MKKIALIGSTGSIGKQVLEIVDCFPEKFKITAIAANRDYKGIEAQMWRYKPDIAVLSDAEYARKVTSVPENTSFYYGENALMHAAVCDADLVFVAVMGFAGFSAVVAAIQNKTDVAIANKEALVAGGEVVTALAEKYGVNLIPVDSEHSAIWQALGLDRKKPFEKLILTASGGAFRDLPIENLDKVTAKEALNHPNWQMGSKITVDCATMVNKGFEVAEAKWLFNCDVSKIDVLLHRQSIIHSMVEFRDGSVISQMATPSMKIPIALALNYPERLNLGLDRLDLCGKSLTFEKIDDKRYPCFSLVKQAIIKGNNYPCAISAANEIAVNAFLQGRIKFTDIYGFLADALESTTEKTVDYQTVVETDRLARSRAISRLNK